MSPEAYVAVRLSLPTARVIVGLLLELSTMTTSLKVAVTETLSPAFNILFCMPSASVIATLLTVGNVVSITNELIFNVALEPEPESESELSVEPESLDESSELVLLNESSFFTQEMMVRLKRDMRIMYKTLFIFFPIS